MLNAEDARNLRAELKMEKVEAKITAAAVKSDYLYLVYEDFEDDQKDETLEALGELGFVVEYIEGDPTESWKVSW